MFSNGVFKRCSAHFLVWQVGLKTCVVVHTLSKLLDVASAWLSGCMGDTGPASVHRCRRDSGEDTMSVVGGAHGNTRDLHLITGTGTVCAR